MPISRRSFIKSSLALSAAAGMGTICPYGFASASEKSPISPEKLKKALSKYRGQSLTISSWGGSFQAAQRKAYFQPFSEEFGIRIVEDSPPTNPKIIAMVKANNVTWDVVDIGAYKVIPLGKQGVLEELDYSVIDTRNVIDSFVMKWGIGNLTYSELLSYRTDVIKNGPSDIAGVWDLKRWPGKRGLRDDPISNLAFALQADGVAPKDVYPLDEKKIQRAYKKLDEVKGDSIWWKQNAQSPVWVANQQVQMATVMNGRMDHYVKEGVPLKLIWNGGQIIGDAWSIPKGTQKKELATLFIAWATLPDVNWRLSKYISYGPVNRDALKYVPADLKKTLPTSYLDEQVVCDFKWWGDQYAKQVDRWRQWMLS